MNRIQKLAAVTLTVLSLGVIGATTAPAAQAKDTSWGCGGPCI